MPASTYLANKLLDHQLGKAAFTMPTVYVALSSSAPQLNGTGVTEPSAGGYARVTTSAATWASAGAGTTSNAAAITFPTATADWAAGSNLTYGVLYDAAAAGNVLAYSVLTVAKNALLGDAISIAIGQLTVTIS